MSSSSLKLLLIIFFCACAPVAPDAAQKPAQPTRSASIPAVPLRPPSARSIPAGPLGDMIRLGRNIMMDTPKYASQYTGNALKCSDCHINGGTVALASPLGGVTTLFPQFSARAGRVITIEDRLNECFVRSENGKPLPSSSREMIAMVAYMTWLSQGVPVGSTVVGRGLPRLTPPAHVDAAAGAKIYAQSCSVCHGADGQGTPGMAPPLWGPHSANNGAGITKAPKMAAFVKANMPPTAPGSLSVQQAFDVSTFVDSHSRPHYNHAYDNF
ncbi:MAG: c-type cytochrome [Terriglobia bacterium]